ncbi:MFS general substrate transporter [Microthyrium microscopicum]|uniref:MFS general substrate transporter n=1 Tax=Microthyrium microscopicum TaxID=703497 RepID=A0A6A6UQ68_9PEZI|nr:MFS general substrate transporter [Microthyrium microscopicum]
MASIVSASIYSSQSRFSKDAASALFNSRFSNWSYHDINGLFKTFGRGPRPTKDVDNASLAEVANEDKIEAVVDEKNLIVEWSLLKKSLHMIVPLGLVFASSLAATSITANTRDIYEDLHGAPIISTLPYSLYIIGLAVGSLTGNAASELFPRRETLFVTAPLFALCQLALGLFRRFGLILAFRLLSGLFASTASIVSYGIVCDMWMENKRTVPTALFFASSFLGATIGPLFGGIIGERLSWRWTQLMFTFLTVPIMVATFYSRETTSTPNDEKTPFKLAAQVSLFIRLTLGRPIMLIFTKPSILFLGLTTGFSVAIQYALYTTLPTVFSGTYHLTWLTESLCFLSLSIGVLLGMSIHILQHLRLYASLTIYWRKSLTSSEAHTQPQAFPARYRLIPALPIVLLLPLSLVLFAFTVVPGYSIFIPLSFVIFLALCCFLLFISSLLYIQDEFRDNERGSAVGGFLFVVYLVGAGLPTISTVLLDRLHLTGMFGVLAAGSLVLGSAVIVFWMKGKRKGAV